MTLQFLEWRVIITERNKKKKRKPAFMVHIKRFIDTTSTYYLGDCLQDTAQSAVIKTDIIIRNCSVEHGNVFTVSERPYCRQPPPPWDTNWPLWVAVQPFAFAQSSSWSRSLFGARARGGPWPGPCSDWKEALERKITWIGFSGMECASSMYNPAYMVAIGRISLPVVVPAEEAYVDDLSIESSHTVSSSWSDTSGATWAVLSGSGPPTLAGTVLNDVFG